MNEEMEHSKEEDEEEDEFPSFGDSPSDFDTVGYWIQNQAVSRNMEPWLCTDIAS